MSQPANDDYSQHISDDEASYHEDASDGGLGLEEMQFKEDASSCLKTKFKAFSISSSEGLEKGYDRFQQLLSQLEAHGAEVSTEDANHKFLRSLPPAWSNLEMIMRTKPDVDTLSIDDLYNNLRQHNMVKTWFSIVLSVLIRLLLQTISESEVPAGFAE
ncbi:hypothetical protein Tco_1317775 [Tanacetum coccineum]